MKINIYMKGPYPQHHGAVVTISNKDEPEYDGMKRYCWIEYEKCDELIATANEHYKGWSGAIIETNILLEKQQPVVIRDELLYALRMFGLEDFPFTAVYSVFDAKTSPFATRLERKIVSVTTV